MDTACDDLLVTADANFEIALWSITAKADIVGSRTSLLSDATDKPSMVYVCLAEWTVARSKIGHDVGKITSVCHVTHSGCIDSYVIIGFASGHVGVWTASGRVVGLFGSYHTWSIPCHNLAAQLASHATQPSPHQQHPRRGSNAGHPGTAFGFSMHSSASSAAVTQEQPKCYVVSGAKLCEHCSGSRRFSSSHDLAADHHLRRVVSSVKSVNSVDSVRMAKSKAPYPVVGQVWRRLVAVKTVDDDGGVGPVTWETQAAIVIIAVNTLAHSVTGTSSELSTIAVLLSVALCGPGV